MEFVSVKPEPKWGDFKDLPFMAYFIWTHAGEKCVYLKISSENGRDCNAVSLHGNSLCRFSSHDKVARVYLVEPVKFTFLKD